MQGLGETTAMLARLRRSARTPRSTTDIGDRSLVETLRFGENPGALRMFSYAPADLAPNAPLVVVLHGCTQSAESYAVHGGWITLADRLGLAILAPEQVAANNPNRCFNWFEPADTARGRGEAASIAAMVATAIQAKGCDPGRVFITGLSAGGAMSAVMLAAYPELFAGGAIIAGLPYGVARSVADALRVMGQGDGRAAAALGALVRRDGAPPLRLTVWHGDADYTVNPANARDLARQWTAATGLAEAPSQVEQLAGRTCSVWRDSAASGSIVELNLVHGLGHGAPLSTRSQGDVGTPGPFMLEAGLSSTLEIARFWGLGSPRAAAPTSGAQRVQPPEPDLAPSRAQAKPAPSPETKPAGVAAQVMGAVSSHVSPEVRETIAKALRAAGLMR